MQLQSLFNPYNDDEKTNAMENMPDSQKSSGRGSNSMIVERKLSKGNNFTNGGA